MLLLLVFSPKKGCFGVLRAAGAGELAAVSFALWVVLVDFVACFPFLFVEAFSPFLYIFVYLLHL